MKKILHIAGCDKFIPPFIKVIKDNFKFSEHEFLLTKGLTDDELIKAENVVLSDSDVKSKLLYYLRVIIKAHQADKIILHGLFDIKLVQILFFMPWLLKKCYWVMWGADLYVHQLGKRNWKWKIKEFSRGFVIKRLGGLVTYIEGDLQLARKWYGAKGSYIECLMYPSNLYKELIQPKPKKACVNIQIGNSADPSNNHIDILKKLLPFKNSNICLYLPLSYGSKEHAEKVIKQGVELFGDKFKPLTELMPFDEYRTFLASVDIAIFNHKRQQAMGNTITLLGLGKTVYIRSDTTQWQFFENKGINVGNVDQPINLDSLTTDSKNIELVKQYFSEENYLKQLTALFE